MSDDLTMLLRSESGNDDERRQPAVLHGWVLSSQALLTSTAAHLALSPSTDSHAESARLAMRTCTWTWGPGSSSRQATKRPESKRLSYLDSFLPLFLPT